MSNDVKFVVGMCVIVVTMFGSATLVSYVMIELVGRVRTDIQDLRESMEALACGEFARKADESNRVVDPDSGRRWTARQRPRVARRWLGPMAIATTGLSAARIRPSEQSGFPRQPVRTAPDRAGPRAWPQQTEDRARPSRPTSGWRRAPRSESSTRRGR